MRRNISILFHSLHGLHPKYNHTSAIPGQTSCNDHTTAHFWVNQCSNWKNPPLEKTLPFTGAQSVCLEISNSEAGAQKNGYYQDVP